MDATEMADVLARKAALDKRRDERIDVLMADLKPALADRPLCAESVRLALSIVWSDGWMVGRSGGFNDGWAAGRDGDNQ